ncbi:MAG: Ig-like domain-containing protein, partial [Terracidiphilus sp.]
MHRFFAVSAVFSLAICAASAQPPIASTTTTLAITANGGAVTTVSQNTAVVLTATVTASDTAVAPGQVTFCDATAKLCSDIHLIGTAQLTASGTAGIKFVQGPGTHSYKAIFLGTPNAPTPYAGSVSTASSLTVNAWSADVSMTTITSSGTPGSYTLTATVTGKASVAPT